METTGHDVVSDASHRPPPAPAVLCAKGTKHGRSRIKSEKGAEADTQKLPMRSTIP